MGIQREDMDKGLVHGYIHKEGINKEVRIIGTERA